MTGIFKALHDRQGLYALLRYSTPAKLANLIIAQMQRVLRQPYLHAYPYKMIIDVSNICNLRCLYCPTGQQVEGRPKGFMSIRQFEDIIDRIGRYAYIVDLFDWGEPFLNKDIYSMIAYAEKSGICTNIHSNFNRRLADTEIEQIVLSGLSYLSASLDGTTQEVYSVYRRQGDLSAALENAGRILSFRKKAGSRKPYMTWQFLVFPHNSHQVAAAEKLASDMGFDKFHATAGITGAVLRDRKNLPNETAVMKDLKVAACNWLWTTATIHWNGGIAPCGLQFKEEADFGSILNGDFRATWNNDKFMHARSLFGRNPAKKQEAVICNQCYKIQLQGNQLPRKNADEVKAGCDA